MPLVVVVVVVVVGTIKMRGHPLLLVPGGGCDHAGGWVGARMGWAMRE